MTNFESGPCFAEICVLPVEEVEEAEDDEQEGDAFLSLSCVTPDDVTPGNFTSSVGTGVMTSSIKLSRWLNWEVLRLPLELLQSVEWRMSVVH